MVHRAALHLRTVGPVAASLVLISVGLQVVSANDNPAALMARAEDLLRTGHGADPEAAAAASAAAQQLGASGGPAALIAHRLLGRVLEDAGRWSEAETVLAAVQGSCAASPQAAACRNELASVLLKLRRTDEAAALLSADDETEAPDRLELRARVARERGQYGPALALVTQAADLRKRGDPRDPALVRTYQAIGDLQWFLGDFELSHDWHVRAVAQADDTLPRNHPWRAASLAALGLSEYELGDLASSRLHREEAIAIAVERRGPNHPETIGYHHELANLEQDVGNYPQALAIYDALLPFVVNRLPSDWSATFLHNLGRLRHRLGDGEAALEADQQALSLWEDALGHDHPYVALAMQAVAADEEMLALFESAQTRYEAAAALWQGHLGENAPQVAAALVGAARAASRRGAEANVGDLNRRIESIIATAPVTETRVGEVLSDLASLWEARHEWGRAASGYERAVRHFTGIFGPTHPRITLLRARWAHALLASGAGPEALREARTADAAWRSHVRRTTRFLTEGQALRVAGQSSDSRDVLLSLVLSGRAKAELALDVLVRDRALCLDEMIKRQRLLRAAPAPARAEVEKAAAVLAQLLYRETEEPALALKARVAAAEARLDAARRGVHALDADADIIPTTDVGASEVLHALPHGSALVSYVRFTDMRGPREANARYLAVTSDAHARTKVFDLGAAADIEQAVRAWRKEVDNLRRVARDGWLAMRRQEEAGQHLRRLVWDPIRGELRHGLVFVVPDAALNLVAWAGLPVGGGRFLVDEDITIHVLSTERDLMSYSDTKAHPRAIGRFVAIGGPAYDLESPVGDGVARLGIERGSMLDCGKSRYFEPLPSSLKEVTDLAARWPVADREVLTGREAAKETFQAAAPGATVLHLATHGFFKSPSCQSNNPAPSTILDPLRTSGLALAGANGPRGADGEEPGLISAAELAVLDLSQAEWAVLSACGSGLGPIEVGEGVLGLRRALAIAGARTIIMSLMDVDDEQTRHLMSALYANRFERGFSTPESLRAAQRSLLTRMRADAEPAHPAYWAAFVTTGDWH